MTTSVELVAAVAADLEELVAIRIEAMRPSLERLGRFDPARARARLTDGFDPGGTRHVVVHGARAGFIAVKVEDGALVLEHLYLRPAFQGRGLGGAVLEMVLNEAVAARRPVRVTALRDSASNRFYLRHGFVKVGESEWDIHYLRPFTEPAESAPQSFV